jgi:apolipoprotein N-acyltransferase
VTAVIDPYGRIVAEAPLYCQTALAARFGFISGQTFYNRYGDVFAWSCVALVIVIVVWGVGRRRVQINPEWRPS